MRAVFTYWSQPITTNLALATDGYTTSYYELVSFKLAVMQAKRHFGTTVFYSDTAGIERFVNQGFIAFDEIHNVYDSLKLYNGNAVPNGLPLVAKLTSIITETLPFIHINSDVFFIRNQTYFNNEAYILNTHDCVVQNVESITTDFYSNGINYINSVFTDTALLQYSFLPVSGRTAYNCNIIGSVNLTFIQQFANDALSLLLGLDYYYLTIPQISVINIMMERYYIAAKVYSYNISNTPITLFPYVNNIYDINELRGLGYVNPTVDAKALESVCLQIEGTYNKLK